MIKLFLALLSFDTWSACPIVLCEVSLVLQAADHPPTTDFRHVVVSLKWLLEQFALLYAILVIESMGPPLVAAVIMEYGLLVQDLTAKVRSSSPRWPLAFSNSKIRITRVYKDFLSNNIDGKITECWLVNEENIFSYFCYVKSAKLVAHDWSSVCLATAYSIKKFCFSVTMVSRFE